jgi:hypothetical protein
MARRTPSRALATALSGLLLLVGAGCGGEEAGQNTGGGEQQGEGPIREGLFHELNGLQYKVFLTRQLNQMDPEDRAYFQGPEPPPGSTYYGVFIQVCNMGEEPRRSADAFKIVDTLGNEFEPVPLPRTNVFAYRPSVLRPGGCTPDEASVPAQAPIGGVLLLYRLPLEAAENRPLELEVQGGFDAEGKPELLAFELDI